jgi:hypothetical protein
MGNRALDSSSSPVRAFGPAQSGLFFELAPMHGYTFCLPGWEC